MIEPREWIRYWFGVAAAANMKDWFWSVFFKLLFLGALLAGAWKTVDGFYQVPNFYAWRQVEVVDNYRTWSRDVRGNDYYSTPYIRYRYQNAAGETVNGKFHERDSGTPPAAKSAEAGDVIFLRIAVPASDADARFGINQQVLEGVGILFTLLLLWAHGRYRVNPVGAKEVIQLFVTWNLLLWGWMWVALP